VMQDLLECKKETAESFAALFPARSSFHDIELKPSAAHALGRTIASAKHSLESLDLHNCYPNHESLKKVCNGLIERHKRFEKKVCYRVFSECKIFFVDSISYFVFHPIIMRVEVSLRVARFTAYVPCVAEMRTMQSIGW